MEKAKNIIATAICGLAFFAVIGAFCDALTNVEATSLLGVCIVCSAVLTKLPNNNAIDKH